MNTNEHITIHTSIIIIPKLHTSLHSIVFVRVTYKSMNDFFFYMLSYMGTSRSTEFWWTFDSIIVIYSVVDCNLEKKET